MVTSLETKEIVQYTEQLLLFQLNAFQDETLGDLPVNLIGVAVTSGPQVYQPTMRLTVKRKLKDSVALAMIRKTIPPYPDNSARIGVVYEFAGKRYQISGGILYVDNEPYWKWQWRFWPTSYSYSATTPPTNWNPLGPAASGIPFFWNAFDLSNGEMGFLITQYESHWPPGTYHGWIEYWDSGDGTVPSTPPNQTVYFQLRIHPKPQTTLAV
jgi:hypothetical protein